MKKLKLFARILYIGIPISLIAFLLGRSYFRERQLMREEAAVRQVLATQPTRFQLVRLSRTKSQFNLLLGQVTTEEDIQFLLGELKRLEIKRCFFAVNTDSSTVMNPKVVQEWKKRE